MQQPDVYIMLAIPCLVNKTFKFITIKLKLALNIRFMHLHKPRVYDPLCSRIVNPWLAKMDFMMYVK